MWWGGLWDGMSNQVEKGVPWPMGEGDEQGWRRGEGPMHLATICSQVGVEKRVQCISRIKQPLLVFLGKRPTPLPCPHSPLPQKASNTRCPPPSRPTSPAGGD